MAKARRKVLRAVQVFIRNRFSFLTEKQLYQDPATHIGSFVRGIPLFAAIAALSAGIVTLL